MDVILTSQIIIFILIMARIGTALTLMPLFGNRNAPARYKIAFTAILSLIFLLTNHYVLTIDTSNLLIIAAAIFSEILNGLVIGFVVVAMMNAIYIAGHMIDLNMGFGMAKVISPGTTGQIAVTSNLYYMLTTILFFITNTHHLMIRAFAISLDTTKLGTMAITRLHSVGIVEIMRETFVIGFQLAMPIVLTILIGNIILGLLSKAMPGLNVFMVGMPFKVMIGLSTLLIILPMSYELILHILVRTLDYMTQVIQAM